MSSHEFILYGRCIICKSPLTDYTWCQTCNAKHFKQQFDKWSSDNDTIDNFIKKTQIEATNYTRVLEWLPFEDIDDVEYLAKGGYGTVHKAKWMNGPIRCYDNDSQSWRRSGKTDIILKSIENLNNADDEFFQEITSQMTSFAEFRYIVRCYGVTKCPINNTYMMIMDYKKDGSLFNYLKLNCKLLTWRQKLELLYTAIKGLSIIHEKGLVHKDFHCGNIVISNNVSYITDFGLCKKVSTKAENGVYGVLPFIAPEVLRGKPYTKAADIYSFGMIMYHIVLGCPPHSDIPHDTKLAYAIVHREYRPNVYDNMTPKTINDLIESCWSENPTDRPTAIKLVKKLGSCRQTDNGIWTEIKKIEENKNSDISQADASNYNIAEGAVYMSQFNEHVPEKR